jgi:hypothetical protein
MRPRKPEFKALLDKEEIESNQESLIVYRYIPAEEVATTTIHTPCDLNGLTNPYTFVYSRFCGAGQTL